MVPRPRWSTGRAASVVLAGILVAVAGVVVAFLGSLCQLGDSCGSSDHATTALGIVMIAAGLAVPPMVAAWKTRRRWWMAAPVVVVAAVVLAAGISDARNKARERQAVASYTAALNVALTIDAAVGFGPPVMPPPTATVAERSVLARRTQQAELESLAAARDRLARYGITLGTQPGPGEVNVLQKGRPYCYRVPLFALRGSATPGDCPKPQPSLGAS